MLPLFQTSDIFGSATSLTASDDTSRRRGSGIVYAWQERLLRALAFLSTIAATTAALLDISWIQSHENFKITMAKLIGEVRISIRVCRFGKVAVKKKKRRNEKKRKFKRRRRKTASPLQHLNERRVHLLWCCETMFKDRTVAWLKTKAQQGQKWNTTTQNTRMCPLFRFFLTVTQTKTLLLMWTKNLQVILLEATELVAFWKI